MAKLYACMVSLSNAVIRAKSFEDGVSGATMRECAPFSRLFMCVVCTRHCL